MNAINERKHLDQAVAQSVHYKREFVPLPDHVGV
jgi:hypothetical protein